MTLQIEKPATRHAETDIAYCETFETPLGPFSVAVDAAGAVLATAFGDVTRLVLSGREAVKDARRTGAAREQVEAYFAGTRRDFDLALEPAGTSFQQQCWRRLREVPFGTTTTYGRLAANLGTSARAVGRANATNPICLIVPCHRVIGADGSLTGYAYGLEIKRWLIEHEAS
jgi:methylated-DNA-[protein]-cysteine S-methyltransferase